MEKYIIHDNEVLKELKENKINFERSGNHGWFEVDLEFAISENKKKMKSGRELYRDGTKLKIYGETGIDLIPGRYFDTYFIKDQDVLEAFKRNNYTVEQLSEYCHVINAYVPHDRVCKLPNGTLIKYDDKGFMVLVKEQ